MSVITEQNAATDAPHFPAAGIPELPRHARLLGLYPQSQPGLWLQRVRVPAGRLTAAQWHGLADIAAELTATDPLHLTTRQDMEIHGLTADNIGRAQTLLHHIGLTTLTAAGDTPRNITVCPCSGLTSDAPELAPLAKTMSEWFMAEPGIFTLPRKFKVSLSACAQGCGQPWIATIKSPPWLSSPARPTARWKTSAAPWNSTSSTPDAWPTTSASAISSSASTPT